MMAPILNMQSERMTAGLRSNDRSRGVGGGIRTGSPTRDFADQSHDLAGDSIYEAVSGMDGQNTGLDENNPRDVTLHMLRSCQFHRGKSGAY